MKQLSIFDMPAQLELSQNYAEQKIDCPEWLQGELVKTYLGTPDKYMRAFEAGKIAIEWGCEPKIWWRFCMKRT